MTVAVCIQCGELKHGAFTPCTSCGFDPVSTEDRAKSLVLTDHFVVRGELEAIGSRIATGETFEYPPEFLRECQEMLEEGPNFEVPPFLAIGCLGLGLGIVALVAWWWWA